MRILSAFCRVFRGKPPAVLETSPMRRRDSSSRPKRDGNFGVRKSSCAALITLSIANDSGCPMYLWCQGKALSRISPIKRSHDHARTLLSSRERTPRGGNPRRAAPFLSSLTEMTRGLRRLRAVLIQAALACSVATGFCGKTPRGSSFPSNDATGRSHWARFRAVDFESTKLNGNCPKIRGT